MAGNGTGGLGELSRELRRLREVAGPDDRKMRLVDAAEQAGRGFSPAKISRIERGQHMPTPADVALLVRVYRAPGDTAERLVRLAEAIKASSRRIVISRHPGTRAAFQGRLRTLAEGADRVVEFSPIIIPGMVQTREYIEAVWATGGGTVEEGSEFVRERLAAQAVVLHDPAKTAAVLMTEGSLGWAAGSSELMVRQLEYIARLAEHPVVRVGVIPFGRPAPVFPVSNWTLYDDHAVVPGILANQTVLNPPDVQPYLDQWRQLEPLASWDEDARGMLQAAADRYRAA